MRDDARRQFIPDALVSTVALLDNTQTVTDTFSYWPYGEVASRTGTTQTPFQFVGTRGYYNDAPGRSYVRARYLDSAAGRWNTQDPTGLTFGLNFFSHNSSNPASLVDPTGFRAITGDEMKILYKLQYTGKLIAPINCVIDTIKRAICAAPDRSKGGTDPPYLKAALWALRRLGPNEYSQDKDLPAGVGGVVGVGTTVPKCNRFVGDAYAVGANLGYNTDCGVPIRGSAFTGYAPYPANYLGNPANNLPNFFIDPKPHFGDFAAFENPDPAHAGHVTIVLGCGVLVYVSSHSVKIGLFPANQSGHLPVVYRRYGPSF